MKDFRDWLNRKPTGRKPKKPLKRSRVRRVSKKRRMEGAEYSAKRAAFLRENRLCQACWPIKQGLADRATEVHHRAGRIGQALNDETQFVAICRPCHIWCHEHPSQARALGLLK